MFRGLKNIASDLRSEVASTEQTVYTHTHSASQSSTGSAHGSRTKRFLPNSLTKHSNGSNGTGSGNGSNGSRSRPKHRVEEELDGRTEDDTVVHRALVKYFREQGKTLPAYLGGGVAAAPPPLASAPTPAGNGVSTSRFSHGSHASYGSHGSHGSRRSYGSATTSQEPVQNQAHAPQRATPGTVPVQQSTTPVSVYSVRPGLEKTESDDYRPLRTDRPILQHRTQSHQPQQQQQQRTAPLNGNSVSSSTGGGSSPRLHSRFSSGGGGSISGSSRFGRRVHS